MLWFWIILGSAVIASLVVLEIRAERKPEKTTDHRSGGTSPNQVGDGGWAG
jgi:hypothetical protein